MTAKRCTVVYALADAQWLWRLELPPAATVADALAAARDCTARDGTAPGAPAPDIAWDSVVVGIFGAVCAREQEFADGDRIEIYRPLVVDPRAARRARVVRAKRAGTS